MKKIAIYLIAAIVVATVGCDETFESSGINSVELNKSALYITHGESETLVATVDPVNASEVVWRSSDSQIATVSQTGVVTAVSVEGQTVITVATKIGKRVATCDVFVNPVRVTHVTLEPTTFDMIVHDIASPFSYVVYPDNADDKFVTWSSSDKDVVTVDLISGEMKALRDGKATITVMSRDGLHTAECVVNVAKIPVTSLSLDVHEFEGSYFETIKLTATLKPDDASFPQCTWTTTNDKVATVTQDGLVTIVTKEEGIATIKVTSDNDKNFWDECVITVLPLQGNIEILWQGSVGPIDWVTSNGLVGPLDMNRLEPGMTVGIEFECSTNFTWWQMRIYGGSWWEYLPSWWDTYGDGMKSFEQTDTNYEFVITQADIDNIKKQGSQLFFAGNGIIIKRIYYIAPAETVIWKGNAIIDWDTKGGVMPVDINLFEPGKILGIDFECAGGGVMRVTTGTWWLDFENWNLPNGDNLDNIPSSETNFELVITQTDIDNMIKQGGSNTVVHIAGQGITITRLYIR